MVWVGCLAVVDLYWLSHQRFAAVVFVLCCIDLSVDLKNKNKNKIINGEGSKSGRGMQPEAEQIKKYNRMIRCPRMHYSSTGRMTATLSLTIIFKC